MVLNKYRKQADSILRPTAEKLSGMNPDTISWLALVFALLSGLFFYFSLNPLFVLLGGFSVILNSLLDALDGKIAKITDRQNKRGDFLDHTLDRYADIFILSGIALGPLCRTWLGLLGIIGVLMTSYMGTQADAIGVSRNYGGIAGRADRLVLIILVSLLYPLLDGVLGTGVSIWAFDLGIFEILMIWLAVAGNATAIYRGINSWSDIEEDE